MCIGDIIPRKRPLEILTATKRLWQEGYHFELHFVGRADATVEYAASFLKEIKGLQQDSVRYLGELSTADLIRSFDGASGLIHFPSEEAFGLVVAEALARDLKLFAANVGGIPDIANGVEGVELFPPTDFASLGAAISGWLNAGAPRPQSAASVMRRRYDPVDISMRHVEIYKEVLSATRFGLQALRHD